MQAAQRMQALAQSLGTRIIVCICTVWLVSARRPDQAEADAPGSPTIGYPGALGRRWAQARSRGQRDQPAPPPHPAARGAQS